MRGLAFLFCFFSLACAQEELVAFPETKQANTQKHPVKNEPLDQYPKKEGCPLTFSFGYDFLLSRILSPRFIYALSMAPDFIDLTIARGEAHFVGFNFTDAHRAFIALGTHEHFFWVADGFYLKDNQTRHTEGILILPFLPFDLQNKKDPFIFTIATATTRVSLQYFDAKLFYSSPISRYFIFEPFIGGRFLHHSNSFKATYNDPLDFESILTFKDQINGGGLVVGTGGKFMLSSHFYFFGNFSLNGVVGRQKFTTEADFPTATGTQIIEFVNRRLTLLTGVQYAAGCGFDFDLGKTVSMSFKLGYEHMTYFRVTQSDFLIDTQAPENFDLQAVTFGLSFGF